MSAPAPKSALDSARKNDAKMVDIKFVDTFGAGQHFGIPISEPSEESFTEGRGFDSSPIRGWKPIEARIPMTVANSTPFTTAAVLYIALEGQSCAPLAPALNQSGYQICEADSVQTAVELAPRLQPVAILLDTDNPGTDGVQAICRLQTSSRVPILVLSKSKTLGDKVAVLDQGATDYLAKPFEIGELCARIRARNRDCPRPVTRGRKRAIFRCGALTVDFVSRIVKVGAERVKLSPSEYRLLALLVRQTGKVLTYRQMLRSLWGSAQSDKIGSLRVCLCSLRNKLEPNPGAPSFLVTEPGIGYRLEIPQ